MTTPPSPSSPEPGLQGAEVLARMRHTLRTPLNHIIGYSEILLESAEEADAEAGWADLAPDLRKVHDAGLQFLSAVNDQFHPEAIRHGNLDMDRLSHTLRTPLNHIVGYSEILAEAAEAEGVAAALPDLARIRAAGWDLVALVDAYLDATVLTAAAEAPGEPRDPAPAGGTRESRGTRESGGTTESGATGPGGAAAAADSGAAAGDSAAPRDASPAGRPAAGAAAGTSADHGHLLVVDDNAGNRHLLVRRFTRQGFTVAEAADGPSALAWIAAEPVDVVLLDIVMPGMSGLEVLAAIRETRPPDDLPVIMVTARDRSADMVTALARGASDYVTKPVDFRVALARVRTQIALKRAAAAVRQLNDQLALRNRFIQQAFGRYVSDEVVAQLLETPEGLEMGGERRVITILMADLRGFTPTAERLAPEQVVALLNNFLGLMSDVVMRYGGTVNAFIGDAVLAMFGAPQSRPDDAERAVACAIAMQREMETVNRRNDEQGLPAIEMGIGIHTGEAVVGNVGSERRTQYSAFGSAVVAAVRVEAYTVGGQILTTAETLAAAGTPVAVTGEMVVHPKGFAEPVAIYDVAGIEGRHAIRLGSADDAWRPLAPPLAVRFTVLDGKRVGGAEHTGELVALSARAGELRTEHALDPLTNLLLQLAGPDGRFHPGDVYAKTAVGSGTRSGTTVVKFTAVAPEVEAWLAEVRAGSA